MSSDNPNGFKTILVLSGGTRRDDLDRYAYQPDKVVDSVADLDPVRLIKEFTTAAPPPRPAFNGQERRKPATSALPG